MTTTNTLYIASIGKNHHLVHENNIDENIVFFENDVMRNLMIINSVVKTIDISKLPNLEKIYISKKNSFERVQIELGENKLERLEVCYVDCPLTDYKIFKAPNLYAIWVAEFIGNGIELYLSQLKNVFIGYHYDIRKFAIEHATDDEELKEMLLTISSKNHVFLCTPTRVQKYAFYHQNFDGVMPIAFEDGQDDMFLKSNCVVEYSDYSHIRDLILL